MRLIVLLAILAIVGAAAGWDWFVARPGYEGAVETAERFLPEPAEGEEDAAPRTEPATQEEVHAALDAEPAAVDTAGPYLIERYAWRRGVPWMEYELWLIYDGEVEPHSLLNATSRREEADLYYATAQHAAAPSDAPSPTPNEGAGPSDNDATSDSESSADSGAPPSPDDRSSAED